ncbi:MAG: hypothetical protein ACD_68C00035G0002 [uncultured bacterium]|nr:MAG: hypothetical protein ACD_68C00035G0002 [uncultured bacterium]
MVAGRVKLGEFKGLIMSNRISIQCKRCRREGKKLFLKGERCYTPKCAIIKRNYPPGIHGQSSGIRKMSEYGKQLREKQSAKNIFGIREKQMRRYYREASKSETVTGDKLMQILEARLDNVVYRLGFANSRSQARQMVGHGHIAVNGKKVRIPSYSVKPEMVIAVKGKSAESILFKETNKIGKNEVPKWLARQGKEMSGLVKSLPDKSEVEQDVDPKLIVEFYSR